MREVAVNAMREVGWQAWVSAVCDTVACIITSEELFGRLNIKRELEKAFFLEEVDISLDFRYWLYFNRDYCKIRTRH